MSKISIASRWIQVLLVVLAFSQLVTHCVLVINNPYDQSTRELNTGSDNLSIVANYDMTNSWETMADSLYAEGFDALLILGTVQLLPYLCIYLFLFKLFNLYRQGQVFTLATSQCLRNVGKTLLFWIAINLFYPLFVTLVIRFGGWSDTLAIHINLGTTEVYYLLLGLIFYVMTWVMTQGIEMKQDQDLVI